MTTGDVLDLYDLALLINYERTSTEPRFRRAKLREVMHNGAQPRTIIMLERDLIGAGRDRDKDSKIKSKPSKDEWFTSETPTKIGYIFDMKAKEQGTEERDSPENMISESEPLQSYMVPSLTATERETIFYQARAHDACAVTVHIMQDLFDLLPETMARVRVRTQSSQGEFITYASERRLYEGWLRSPKLMLYNNVLRTDTRGLGGHPGAMSSRTYLSGETTRIKHWVLAFYNPSKEKNVYRPDVILDMSSMQFGLAGRGFRGKGLFVLEGFEEYSERMRAFSDGMDPTTIKVSERMIMGEGMERDDLELAIASRVKERLYKRATEHWCGRCGAPATQRCGKCGKVYFCNREHSVAGWPMHKGICK